jgi:hypothetical protein
MKNLGKACFLAPRPPVGTSLTSEWKRNILGSLISAPPVTLGAGTETQALCGKFRNVSNPCILQPLLEYHIYIRRLKSLAGRFTGAIEAREERAFLVKKVTVIQPLQSRARSAQRTASERD